MRFRLALYALAFTLCMVCIAPATSSLAATAAAAPARSALTSFSRGLLWKVQAKGGRASYLFGTMHSDDDRVLALPAAVKNAFDNAPTFAVEVVGDDASVRKFLNSMVTREPQLPALLGDEDYARVDHLLAEHGIPSEARPRLKPWAAMVTLLQPRGATGMVLDRVLLHDAKQRHKRIRALESVEEQIIAFDGMAQESQVRLLHEVAKRYPDIQQSVGPLIEAYLARDLAMLWRLNVETMAGDSEAQADNQMFFNRILFDRNERFAHRLAPLLRSGNAFVAFGALHLYGERGVLTLLQQRGFKVQRVY
jgi:uncharacterized protein